MRKIAALVTVLVLAISAGAQTTFWTENFTSGSGALPYTGPNGTWTSTILSPEGASPNRWYVSCTEGGKLTGICGSVCATGDLGATLHLGSDPFVGGDLGAAYFNGGCFTYTTYFGGSYTYGICAATDRRAESPLINCTGRTGITLSFYYIENGDTTTDNGTVWYNDGTGWTLLDDPPKTALCGSGQGTWTHRILALPTSANNNPGIKIGFRWVNNEDGMGSDPSFAVDSVALGVFVPPVASFTVSPVSATVCQDSCMTFTSTSSGTVGSVLWRCLGATIASPTSPSTTACFPAPGTYVMHMYAYGPVGADSVTQLLTVNAAPVVHISNLPGNVLSVSSAYSMYQWAKGFPVPVPISGASGHTYTYSSPGTYWVVADSAGCLGVDTIFISPVAVPQVASSDNRFWVTPAGEGIVLNAANSIGEAIFVNIFDAGGRELYAGTWQSGAKSMQVTGVAFVPGMYTIRLTGRTSSQVLKWIAP